jgi:D-arabinose 1-dehydrogenase-like Zn-dependent alcohol dehydrogenase
VTVTQTKDRLAGAVTDQLTFIRNASVRLAVVVGGVVVDVVVAGVSYADLLQTTGEYQLRVPVPFSPGMNAAGVVRSAPA